MKDNYFTTDFNSTNHNNQIANNHLQNTIPLSSARGVCIINKAFDYTSSAKDYADFKHGGGLSEAKLWQELVDSRDIDCSGLSSKAGTGECQIF